MADLAVFLGASAHQSAPEKAGNGGSSRKDGSKGELNESFEKALSGSLEGENAPTKESPKIDPKKEKVSSEGGKALKDDRDTDKEEDKKAKSENKNEDAEGFVKNFINNKEVIPQPIPHEIKLRKLKEAAKSDAQTRRVSAKGLVKESLEESVKAGIAGERKGGVKTEVKALSYQEMRLNKSGQGTPETKAKVAAEMVKTSSLTDHDGTKVRVSAEIQAHLGKDFGKEKKETALNFLEKKPVHSLTEAKLIQVKPEVSKSPTVVPQGGTHSATKLAMGLEQQIVKQPKVHVLTRERVRDLFRLLEGGQQMRSMLEGDTIKLEKNTMMRSTLTTYLKNVSIAQPRRVTIELATPPGAVVTLYLSRGDGAVRGQFSTSDQSAYQWLRENIHTLKNLETGFSMKWLPPQIEQNKAVRNDSGRREDKRKRESERDPERSREASGSEKSSVFKVEGESR